MTAEERLIGVRAKLKRAKEHIRDFEGLESAFRKSSPYGFKRNVDTKTGEVVYNIRVLKYPPLELSLVAGEVIHQLRSGLDHLACRLVEVNGPGKIDHTEFPIYNTRPKDKSAYRRKVKGISPGAIALIESLQPYHGRNQDLGTLHDLDNIYKHRLLPTVGYGDPKTILTFTKGPVTPQSGSITLTGQASVLEDGAELGRVSPAFDLEMDKNLNAAFDVAFREPQIVQGQPVSVLLQKLSHLVGSIVDQFVPFLK